MKKFVTVLLVLALAGAMITTTAFAAPDAPTGGTNAANAATVLIKARATFGGQIAMNAEGGEPVFDPDHPMDSAGANIAVGKTVSFSAKANEGYKFLYWLNEDTDETYSTDATITIEASEPLNLVAAFDRDVERVLIVANAAQGGQIAMDAEGGEPEFDPDHPMNNAGGNIAVGDTVAFSAKADEGWMFMGWMIEGTEKLYSLDETIYVTAEEALSLVAVFDEDVEKVLIKANTQGMGQIAMNEEGGEPEFDPEYPKTSAFANVRPGDTVVFGAKADEGWMFVDWKDAATGKTLSTEETFAVTVDKDMEIVAIFEMIENNNNDGEKKDNSGSNTPADTTPTNTDTTSTNGGTATSTNGGTATPANGSTATSTNGDTAIPATGDATPAAALAAVTLGSLGAAVMLGKKRKDEK